MRTDADVARAENGIELSRAGTERSIGRNLVLRVCNARSLSPTRSASEMISHVTRCAVG